MQQSKAEDRYSCETLLSMNTLYDHEHHLTQADVDAANALVRHIERTRNPRVPQVGDRVRYTTLPVGCNACGATTVKGPPLTEQPIPPAVIHTKGTYGHRQI